MRFIGRSGRILQTLRAERRVGDEARVLGPGLRIREAEESDCPAIAEMANDLARETGSGDGGMTALRVERDLLGSGRYGLTLGECDGRPAGYALFTTTYETAQAAHGLYLSDLYVDRDARRRGLARGLMADLAARCRSQGGDFIWWIVMPGNQEAEAFYASLGAVSDQPRAMALHGRPFDVLIASRAKALRRNGGH